MPPDEIKINNAVQLFKKGFTPEEVSQNTGLDSRRVNNIQKLLERGLSVEEIVQVEQAEGQGPAPDSTGPAPLSRSLL